MKKPQLDYRFFRVLIGIQVISLLAFVAPFLIGRYCGHAWGLLAAVGDILGWLYLNQKYFGKHRLALSTRIIWLLALAVLVMIAIFEFTHLTY